MREQDPVEDNEWQSLRSQQPDAKLLTILLILRELVNFIPPRVQAADSGRGHLIFLRRPIGQCYQHFGRISPAGRSCSGDRPPGLDSMSAALSNNPSRIGLPPNPLARMIRIRSDQRAVLLGQLHSRVGVGYRRPNRRYEPKGAGIVLVSQ